MPIFCTLCGGRCLDTIPTIHRFIYIQYAYRHIYERFNQQIYIIYTIRINYKIKSYKIRTSPTQLLDYYIIR